MSEIKLLPCPICAREIDIEKNLYIPERDWKPTFYDPDSGGDPISIHCECGLEFSIGTYDWSEFEKAWNTRKPMQEIVEMVKEKSFVDYDEYYTDCGEMLISFSDVIEIVKEVGGMNENLV